MDASHPTPLTELKHLNVRLPPAAHAYLLETRRLVEERGLAALPYPYQAVLREMGSPTSTAVLVTVALRNLLIALDPMHGLAVTRELRDAFGPTVPIDEVEAPEVAK